MRVRWIVGAVGLWALLPLSASGQFFRDDFDGNALNSRWLYATGEIPTRPDFTVANGRWRLNQLFPEGGLQGGGGVFYADLGPQLGPLTMRARVGWDQSSPFIIGILASARRPTDQGSIRMIRGGGGDRVGVLFFNRNATITLPSSGFHDFEWTRDDSRNYRFLVNGQLVLETRSGGFPDEHFRYFGFMFSGPVGSGHPPVYMDSIEVVPEPGTLTALGLGLAALAARRKKKG